MSVGQLKIIRKRHVTITNYTFPAHCFVEGDFNAVKIIQLPTTVDLKNDADCGCKQIWFDLFIVQSDLAIF